MKNSIKIWPDLSDISQALIPYSDSSLNLNNIVHIDFSNIKSISSSGATLALVKLINIIHKNKNATWNIEQPESPEVKKCLKSIGFYNILLSRIKNKDLFLNIENDTISKFSHVNKQEVSITSYPIHYLSYERNRYREGVEEFSDWITEILNDYSKLYDFRFNVFAKLLKEIAKNSEDHTSDNAFFGIDIIENHATRTGEILFSFCDLGIGIHENIKKYIKTDPRFRNNASEKLGIVDSYHNAFTQGFSTSKSISNKGIGMSMILDCTNLLELELSFFDARSRGFIPRTNTHDEIRRNFWNTGNPVGFYYYGKLNIKGI